MLELQLFQFAVSCLGLVDCVQGILILCVWLLMYLVTSDHSFPNLIVPGENEYCMYISLAGGRR